MSDRLHGNQDDSCDNSERQPSLGLPPDFLDARSRKRELLDEMSTGWAEGRPVRAEELLPRWPTNPAGDGDVASLLFEEYQQRRDQGDDVSLADIHNRFPEHHDSLAALMRGHDVFRSVSGSCKSVPRLTLPSVGDELFGFRMRHELGRGAFACVFMAEQEHLAGRPVVLKVSALEGNEPQTLAQLQHTHIVPIYSVHDDVAAGVRAVCMPYFGGASLSAVLHAVWAETPRPTHGEQVVRALEVVQAPKWEPKRSGDTPSTPAATTPAPLAWLRANSFFRTASQLVAQLAEGLDHAHERGIYHRDIKPSNILLAVDGTPMLLDFNLAEDINTPKARASATLGGTVSYMAPEHLRALAARDPVLARKVDHRSDIYSLGMVLYEMLVGQSPFKQSASYSPIPTLIEAMAVERGGGAPSLRKKRPDAPWDLESILRKCLDPNPERRYQRAAQLAEDLQAYLGDQPLRHAPQLSRTERVRKWLRRHPRLTSSGSVATVAAVLLLTAGAALLGMRGYLRSAEHQVEANNVRQKLRLHDAGTLRALCLVNVADAHDENLRQGAEVCATTLQLFGVLDREDWANESAWKHLSDEERNRLAENTRELLLLLAWAKVRGAPDNPAVLREALALVERAEAIPGLPPTPALLEERAHYLEKLGKMAEAETIRAQAKQLLPATARDHYLLATTHVRAGRREEALKALDRAVSLNPHHYWSSVQRGLVQLDRRMFHLAAEDFSVCIGLAPKFAWGYFNRAYARDQMGAKSEAIEDYTKAIECDPNFAMAYQNRAAIWLELGQHEEALADLDRALAMGRDEAVLLASRAMALEALRRHDDSEAAIKKALARADFNAEKEKPGEDTQAIRIRWSYGFAIAARKPELARRLFEEVLTRKPEHAQALYGRGMLLAAADQAEEALPFFDRALDADRNFTHARRFRAVVLARLSRFAEALEDINVCLRAEPTSGPTLYAAACVASRIAAETPDPLAAREAVDQAIRFLDQAFRQQYGAGRVDDDPDLAFVRQLPQCRRFLKTAVK